MATGEGALVACVVAVCVGIYAEMDTHEAAHAFCEEVDAAAAGFVGNVDEGLVEEDVIHMLLTEPLCHRFDELDG